MTVALKVDSPRRAAARRFGDELRRTMKLRGVGQVRVAKQAGVAASAIGEWRGGRNLPRLDTAIRLAECLGNDKLATIVREGRTQSCVRCGRPFLNEGGAPKKYCSPTCVRVAQKLRVGLEDEPVGELVEDQPDFKHRLEMLLLDVCAGLNDLMEHEVSVLHMCQTCEPEGYCRTPDCPLRPVSPLPIQVGRREVSLATPAPGCWSAEHREKMLKVIRDANARRWARAGEREAHIDRMLERTPEQRAAAGRKISATKRARAASRPRGWADERRVG